jgi:exopolysaccharide biosynthesis polyprenyl glycosylphosphotransferase
METVEACIGGQCRCLDGAEVVFLCGVHSHDRNTILKYCVEHGIVVYLLPRIGDTIMNGAKPMHLFHMPFLRVGRYDPSPEYMLLKRTFDIVVSGVALLVLSPLMLIVAIAIKATDGGTVFYKQTRLTKDGKEFDIVKFRSMRQDAEKDGVARLSSGESDPRITPIGRIIRKLRVDELPQLINIFTGSMSVVGPRPERPEIAKVYEKELPEFSLRLQAKAGLTGYAQVYGKYNTTPYDKLQLDLLYIAHPSFLEDLRIIFATVKILFMPKSVEGIDENAITAMENPEEELVEV